jgi:uncharacterized protein (TIGR03437 family)
VRFNRSLFALLIVFAVNCPPSIASTDLTLNFSGATSQVLQGHSGTGSGSGTISPYGSAIANVSANGLDVVTVSITISLANGDYFQATTQSASGDGNTVTGTATIVGATGQFSGISGALNFTLTFSPSGSAGTFTLTGYGSVGSGQQTLVVSQTGVRFHLTAGTGVPPPQTILVSNSGTGSLAFTATSSTLSGNRTWLSVTPTTGTGTAAAPAAVNIAVDPTGLGAGNYYGLVDLAATGATNSPQLVEVVLNVLDPGVDVRALIDPTGLIFVARSGSNPAPQTVQLGNPSDDTWMLITQPIFQQGNGWFSVSPASGALLSDQTLPLTVSIDTTSLTPGTYNGTLQVQIAGEPAPDPVAILLLVLPPVSTSQFLPKPSALGSCTPSELLPVFTLLGNSFQTPAAWPAPLQVNVVDNCGAPMIAGSVDATFSSGDPELALAPIGGGQWAATWAPHKIAGGQVTITVNAQVATPSITGMAQLTGSVTANLTTPVMNGAGVVSAASFKPVAVAPGSFISIFGANLATGLSSSPALPLETALGGTLALMGDQLLPLQFTSTGQINAIVPYGMPVNATQQLLIQQSNAYSLPASMTIAVAQPAVFTQDQSGQGAGIIVVVKPDQTQFLATPASPASAGDALVIYCAGLGEVSPAVPAGSAAPTSSLSTTVNTTTAAIGGQPAPVLFSGLAPGFAGLYQVDVLVPPGIASAPNVPVILTVGGISSPPVTVAIK